MGQINILGVVLRGPCLRNTSVLGIWSMGLKFIWKLAGGNFLVNQLGPANFHDPISK
jgi:hypothetical protein